MQLRYFLYWSALISALWLVGCQSDDAGNESALNPDIRTLMDPMLNEASEVVWDSAGFIDTYEGTTDLTPTTPEGWQRVTDAANDIDQFSTMLKQEQYSLNRQGWIAISQSLAVASEEIKASVQAEDGDALFQAGAQLYQVCVACHQSYWSNNRFVETE